MVERGDAYWSGKGVPKDLQVAEREVGVGTKRSLAQASNDDDKATSLPLAKRARTEPRSEKVNVDEELRCCVCLETFKDPVSAPCCGNTFCRACLDKTINEKTSCPTCRAAVTVPVSQLPGNLVVRQLLDKLSSATKLRQRKDKFCDTCDGCLRQDERVECYGCKRSYCHDCWKKATAEPIPRSTTANGPNVTNTCPRCCPNTGVIIACCRCEEESLDVRYRRIVRSYVCDRCYNYSS